MISAKLIYNDGKDVIVNIPGDEFAKMFASLAQGQVYWDANQTRGFWTSFENIRYIEFLRSEDQCEPKQDCIGTEPCAGAQCESAPAGEPSSQD